MFLHEPFPKFVLHTIYRSNVFFLSIEQIKEIPREMINIQDIAKVPETPDFTQLVRKMRI